MPIQAQSADGVMHEFPDGTDGAVIDRVMKAYATQGRTGPGGRQVPQQGVEGPSTMVAGIPSQRATAIKETITGPEEGTQADWLSRQQAIERNLRGQGKTDAEIEQNPEWMEAARNLNRAVMSGVSSTAIGAAGGDVAAPAVARAAAPVMRALGGAPSAVAKTIERVFPGATARATERVTKIGAPTTESDLGNRMHSVLLKKLTAAQNARRAQAQRDIGQAFGMKETAAPMLSRFRSYLDDITKTADQDLSPPERRLLERMRSESGLPKTVEAVDKMRRELNGMKYAKDWEGAEAIPKVFASRLAGKLTEIMESENPHIGSYLKNYAEASKPISLYRETALGQGVSKQAAGFPAADVATLPDKFFRTKQSIDTLKQLADDPAFVDSSARIHAASELDRVTQGRTIAAAATRARAWANANKGWLDELPGVRDAAERYISNLEVTAKTQKIVKVTAALSAIPFLYEAGPWAFYRGAHILGAAP